MTEDKRIRRTKKLLKQSLCELMKQKPFKNITVSDIVRQADINRGTFYAYYQDVYDLREKVENEMTESLKQIIQSTLPEVQGNSMKTSIKKSVEYLKENRELAYVLLKDGNLEHKMTLLIAECCKKQLYNNYTENDEWEVCFIATGCLGIMKHCMMQTEDIDEEKVINEIDSILRKFFV